MGPQPLTGQAAAEGRWIRYRCPGCDATLENPSFMAGRKDTCPLCGEASVVPTHRSHKRLLAGGGVLAAVLAGLSLGVWMRTGNTPQDLDDLDAGPPGVRPPTEVTTAWPEGVSESILVAVTRRGGQYRFAPELVRRPYDGRWAPTLRQPDIRGGPVRQYAFWLVRADGSVSVNYPFTHDFTEPAKKDSASTRTGGTAEGLASFSEKLPFPEDTRRIVLLEEGKVVAEKALSPLPPRITLGKVEMIADGRIRIPWEVSDDDDKVLRLTLRFTDAGGEHCLEDGMRLVLVPAPHAAGHEDSRRASEGSVTIGARFVEFDGLVFHGGKGCRVVVQVCDGQNTTTADTEPFDTPVHAMDVTVLSPANGEIFAQGEPIRLSVRAAGRAGSAPSAVRSYSYQWKSDRDGTVTGESGVEARSLSLGTHRLTVSATARNGLVTQDRVEISVLAPGQITPDLLLESFRRKDAGARCRMITRVVETSWGWMARESVFAATGALPDARARAPYIPVFLQCLEEELKSLESRPDQAEFSAVTVQALAEALCHAGREWIPRTMPPLIKAMRVEAVRSGVLSNAALLDKAAVPYLVAALKDKRNNARAAIVSILGQMGPLSVSAVPDVIDALREQDEQLLVAAESALVASWNVAHNILTPHLDDDDPLMRSRICLVLSRFAQGIELTRVAEVFAADQDAAVRLAAACALAAHGEADPRVVAAVTTASAAQDPYLRDKAARILAKIRPPAPAPAPAARLGDLSDRTIAQLAEMVKDHLDPAVHNDEVTYLEPVIRELGRRGAPAIPALLSALWSSYMETSVTEELARIGEASIIPVLTALDTSGDHETPPMNAMGCLARAEPTREATRRALLRALANDGRPLVRQNVARLLTKLRDPSTAAALTEALKDDDPGVRAQAVEGVSVVCPGPSVPALCRLLKDPSEQVSRNAASALARIQDPASAVAMMEGVRDCTHPWVCIDLAKGLENLGDRRAVGPLIQCMSRMQDELVVAFCADALGTLRDKSAVRPLKAVLARKGMQDRFAFRARHAIAEAMVRIGRASVPVDTQLVSDGIDVLIDDLRFEKPCPHLYDMSIWQRVGEPAAGPLVRQLGNPNGEIRERAAAALEKIGPPALGAIRSALTNADENIRGAAVGLLGRLADPRAEGDLIPLLADPKESRRIAAIQTLRQLQTPQAPDALAGRLLKGTPDEQFEAACALAELGDARGIPLLSASIEGLPLAPASHEARSAYFARARRAAECLVRLGVKALPAVARAAAGKDPGGRMFSLWILPRLRGPRDLLLYLEGLSDDVPEVRAMALCALARYKSQWVHDMVVKGHGVIRIFGRMDEQWPDWLLETMPRKNGGVFVDKAHESLFRRLYDKQTDAQMLEALRSLTPWPSLDPLGAGPSAVGSLLRSSHSQALREATAAPANGARDVSQPGVESGPSSPSLD